MSKQPVRRPHYLTVVHFYLPGHNVVYLSRLHHMLLNHLSQSKFRVLLEINLLVCLSVEGVAADYVLEKVP